MKKIILALIAVVLVGVGFSQDSLSVLVEKKAMSKGTQTAFSIAIPGANLKDAETMWGKYVSRGSKAKVQNVAGEWVIMGAVERNISANPVNVYAIFLQTTTDLRVSTFFSEGSYEETFYAADPNNVGKSLAIEKYIKDYESLVLRSIASAKLDGEQKGLKALENELKNLEKDFDKSAKNISESKRKIEKNETEIKKIDKEVDAKNAQILQQKDAISKMTTLGDAKKTAQKDLSSFEKEKKTLLKDKEKLAKEIDKSNAEIRSEEGNITKMNTQREAKLKEIAVQQEKVKEAENKLNAIPNPGIKL